jgi:hypothetical protein
MFSAPNEDAAVLPNLVSVNRPWSDGAEGRQRRFDGLRQVDAVGGVTRHGRALAILEIVFRVLIVFGVLTALERLV